MRKISFVNNEIYHIFNRGTEKRVIFHTEKDLDRFVRGLKEFNQTYPVGSLYWNSFNSRKIKSDKKLVEIIAYCLNPNHFHLLLKQLVDNGISKFMKKVGGGYVSYFNHQNHRNGVLFQGPFKAKHINSNEYLLYISAYVNLNMYIHKLSDQVAKFYRSSWDEYVDLSLEPLCRKGVILEQFSKNNEYIKFAYSALEIIRNNKKKSVELENLLLE